jgi:tellurite resistance protein TehA-like permease
MHTGARTEHNANDLVLIVPFVLCFLSNVRISEGITPLAHVLFYFVLFLLAVLSPRLLFIARTDPFSGGWWGVCFPLSLLAIGAFDYVVDQNLELLFPRTLAVLLLAISSLATIFVACLAFGKALRFISRSRNPG